MGSSFRCHWMLAELGLEYANPSLNMTNGEHKQAPYLAINPAGQVPALQDDDFALTESAAIVHYLAEKHNPSLFGPNTPQDHATRLRWELFVLLNLDKNFSTLASKTWGAPATPEAEAKAIDLLTKMLPVFEGWLSNRAYIMGDDFTTADVIARSSFMYAEAVAYDVSSYPAITAWLERCSARPAFLKAKG